MIWSLSKDDDGLEPAIPRVSPQQANGASSTVVVDPVSQIPQASASEFGGHRLIEPTTIIRGRSVDRLRAEVAQRRKDYQRRKLLRLFLWGMAGAASVVLGAVLAGSLLPESWTVTAGMTEEETPNEREAEGRSEVQKSVSEAVRAEDEPSRGLNPVADQRLTRVVDAREPARPSETKSRAAKWDELSEEESPLKAPGQDASDPLPVRAVSLDDLPFE